MARLLWCALVAAIGVAINTTVFAAGGLFDIASQIGEIQKGINEGFAHIELELPPDEKKQFHLVVERLNHLSLDKLYFLKGVDTCKFDSTLFCGELKSAQVKPLVEAEIERRSEVLAGENASTSRYISLAGFGVSALSLLVSFLGFRVKKAESKPAKKDDGMASAAP